MVGHSAQFLPVPWNCVTNSESRVENEQKSEAYKDLMSSLHQNDTLEQLDNSLSDLSDSGMAAVLARPRTGVVFPAGCGADALRAALELAELIH
jgi:hypothetical protein